jgi:hypothetical protein
MTVAAGGRTEEHAEQYDRLLVAASELKLHENVVGELPSELQMRAPTTNIGTLPPRSLRWSLTNGGKLVQMKN